MYYPRPCGCKGNRTCLVCEKEYDIKEHSFITEYKKLTSYVFCYHCNRIYPGENVDDVINEHPNHDLDKGLEFPGIYVETNFISPEEEKSLTDGFDGLQWDTSQSGRRKQNYGPRTNFKKMKLASGKFNGFPEYSRFVQEQFNNVPLLQNYRTIEQCSLEYDPDKGASIDPHIDDCWIWGERVVTVNCLADAVLTLVRYKGDPARYNLSLVKSYESELISPLLSDEELSIYDNLLVKLPMPNRSLIVLYGPPRYQFEHSVLRTDIASRRVCIAYREFTPLYLKDGIHADQGKPILEQAEHFWNEADTI